MTISSPIISEEQIARWNAARDRTIEECAVLLDGGAQDLNRQRDPGMANHLRAWAKKIRALKSTST